MWCELSNLSIILLNVLWIPLTHILLAWVSTILPISFFYRANNVPACEFEMMLQHRVFFTRKWKNILPDAAPWLGGFAKGKLLETSPEYLRRFVIETRRGEFSHWLQMALICGFILWNPWPANLIIVCYALLSNLPCILNLRYTRARIIRVLNKST